MFAFASFTESNDPSNLIALPPMLSILKYMFPVTSFLLSYMSALIELIRSIYLSNHKATAVSYAPCADFRYSFAASFPQFHFMEIIPSFFFHAFFAGKSAEYAAD